MSVEFQDEVAGNREKEIPVQWERQGAFFPGVGSRSCQDSVSECAKSPSHPYLRMNQRRGRKSGGSADLTKELKKSGWKEAGWRRSPSGRSAEQLLPQNFYKWEPGSPIGSYCWYELHFKRNSFSVMVHTAAAFQKIAPTSKQKPQYISFTDVKWAENQVVQCSLTPCGIFPSFCPLPPGLPVSFISSSSEIP